MHPDIRARRILNEVSKVFHPSVSSRFKPAWNRKTPSQHIICHDSAMDDKGLPDKTTLVTMSQFHTVIRKHTHLLICMCVHAFGYPTEYTCHSVGKAFGCHYFWISILEDFTPRVDKTVFIFFHYSWSAAPALGIAVPCASDLVMEVCAPVCQSAQIRSWRPSQFLSNFTWVFCPLGHVFLGHLGRPVTCKTGMEPLFHTLALCSRTSIPLLSPMPRLFGGDQPNLVLLLKHYPIDPKNAQNITPTT